MGGQTGSLTMQNTARTANQNPVKRLQVTRECARVMPHEKALQTLNRTTRPTLAHPSVSAELCVLSRAM